MSDSTAASKDKSTVASTVKDTGAGLFPPGEPSVSQSRAGGEAKTTSSSGVATSSTASSSAEAAINQLEHDLAHAALASEDSVGDGIPWAQVHAEEDRARAWQRRVQSAGPASSSRVVPHRREEPEEAIGRDQTQTDSASSWWKWWPASRSPDTATNALPVMRVNQLGAGELDDQLTLMLLFQFNRIFRFFNFPFTTVFKPEIEAILQALIFRYSIFVDVPSPGQQLQNLRYRNESHPVLSKGAGNAPPPQVYALTSTQKLLSAVLLIGGRYGWTRLQSYMIAKGWAVLESTSWRNRFFRLCEALDKLYRASSLLNFLVFLVDGKYPSVVARLLRMRLVYIHSRVGRQVNFEFMDQQLTWHGFSEFLLFIMPLINFSWIRQLVRRLFGNGSDSGEGDASCPVCHTFPPTTPYQAQPCGHVYCYYCLHASIISEQSSGGFSCRRCKQNVDSLTACPPEHLSELIRRRRQQELQ